MSLSAFTEFSILGFSFYYLYRLITDYKYLKSSIPFYEDNKIFYRIAFVGVFCLILSFQVYWFTTFYTEHRYLAIFSKIISGILSLFNQIFITEVEREKEKTRKRKKHDKDVDEDELLNGPADKKLMFKLINRLFLLDIAIKIFGKVR